jgi:hypothetical protein
LIQGALPHQRFGCTLHGFSRYPQREAGKGITRPTRPAHPIVPKASSLQSPFTLEVSTPSGPFQPVRSAKVKLNGNEVASVSWPEKPTSSVAAVLLSSNKIELELDGPAFGSVEVTVRGTPA